MNKTMIRLMLLMVIALVVLPAALWHQSKTQSIGMFEYILIAMVVAGLLFGFQGV